MLHAIAELIFDIGMHNGDDTAYYLASGYDVVAIEANSALCEAAAERFAAEIAGERLTVRNVGIAERAGELEFWISEQSDWSSFHKQLATRNHRGAARTLVRTVAFADLLGEYRRPLYVKVDIEANDSLCVADLSRCPSPPPYFSFEAHDGLIADVDALDAAGYTAFKCIGQLDWREITPETMHERAVTRTLIARSGSLPGVGARVRRLLHGAHLQRMSRRARPLNGWNFAPGSSGPLACELPGRWLSREELLAVWDHQLWLLREMNGGEADGLGEWCDVHAALAPR
jgi:FkbM family methyltransferase